jgi:hypothetical protein
MLKLTLILSVWLAYHVQSSKMCRRHGDMHFASFNRGQLEAYCPDDLSLKYEEISFELFTASFPLFLQHTAKQAIQTTSHSLDPDDAQNLRNLSRSLS